MHDWKSCVVKATVGSNPTLSAIFSLCEKRSDLLRKLRLKFFEEKFYDGSPGEDFRVLRNRNM